MSPQYEVLYAISQELLALRSSFFLSANTSKNKGSETLFIDYEKDLVNAENLLKNAINSGISYVPEDEMFKIPISELKEIRKESILQCKKCLDSANLIDAVKNTMLHLQTEKVLNLRCHVCSYKNISS
ncbi:MAG: hypothetical protein M0P71_01240 [Melioribacteraceae bacterium]|nr:hypothetical protein [Melioribacteraceae bacterium]